MGEYRIFGPPGTGKTTRLATRDIPRAVEKYGPDAVMVTSFSRAAARTIATKGLDVAEENVGTLHSICFHALGNPEMVEDHVDDFSEKHPEFALSSLGTDEGEAFDDTYAIPQGKEIYNEYNLLRQKLIPEDRWPIHVVKFHKAWTQWKDDNFYHDFIDLINRALKELKHAPNDPRVLFVDEAQDNTPMMLALCRKWGSQCEHYVLCGDDDQCIYGFSGASVDDFLKGTPENKRVLSQSYRVPKKVHELAHQIIHRVKRRETKEYAPTPEDGEIIECGTDEILDMIVPGRRTAILFPCSYIGRPIIRAMREKFMPFWNPFKPHRGDWNPIQRGNTKTISAADLLGAFMGSGEDGDYWTVPQLVTWGSFIKTGEDGAIKGKRNKVIEALKNAVELNQGGLESCRGVLHLLLTPSAVNHALGRDLGWFRDNLLAARAKTIEYPIGVLENHGMLGLTNTPKITVGTIHSFKGEEADDVILFPDISRKMAIGAMQDQNFEDELHRLFYVGVTRTKNRLIIPAARERAKYEF